MAREHNSPTRHMGRYSSIMTKSTSVSNRFFQANFQSHSHNLVRLMHPQQFFNKYFSNVWSRDWTGGITFNLSAQHSTILLYGGIWFSSHMERNSKNDLNCNPEVLENFDSVQLIGFGRGYAKYTNSIKTKFEFLIIILCFENEGFPS